MENSDISYELDSSPLLADDDDVLYSTSSYELLLLTNVEVDGRFLSAGVMSLALRLLLPDESEANKMDR